MKKFLKYLVLVCFIGIIGTWFYLNRERGNPEENFEYFFKTFEENYASQQCIKIIAY